MNRYEQTKETYKSIGVDTEKAIEILKNVPIAMHCWRGDDEKSYHALVIVEGNIKLENEIFVAGETIFIPAGEGEYKLIGNSTVLLTTN